MGEFDDGFEDDMTEPYQFQTLYRTGHTDGYTHFHGGPFYKTFAAAKIAGQKAEGGYAVDPKPYECIVLKDGRIYVIDGPYKSADEVALEAEVKKKLLEKLTPYEKKILGIKE